MSPAPMPAANESHEHATRLGEAFRATRERSRVLALPLSAEDAMVQSMDDASPSKWHLAHTTWFFERFMLAAQPGYRPVDPAWDVLFNSYYQSVGPMHARPKRGLLSRPTLGQVMDYRHEVETRLLAELQAGRLNANQLQAIQLGIQHEQQHQELLLTDIKHAFWSHPMAPAYRQDLIQRGGQDTPQRWIAVDERIGEIGMPAWPTHPAFAYDNESPRHRVLVGAHALASRPVNNHEYGQFIAAGGYRTPALWLSDGWNLLQQQDWRHPLYWHAEEALEFTLGGWRVREPHAPVCHLSYYEADAFARWAGARLPTEAEWELAAANLAVDGNFIEQDALHPMPPGEHAAIGWQQMFGDVWEWTASAYSPYPGFQPLPGSLGEYNGKFMCGQWVLRGGSCASPRGHLRAGYRNFFPPDARWQFSGIRLARNGA